MALMTDLQFLHSWKETVPYIPKVINVYINRERDIAEPQYDKYVLNDTLAMVQTLGVVVLLLIVV